MTELQRKLFLTYTVQEKIDNWFQAKFKVGVQQFDVGPQYMTSEEANGMRKMIAKALSAVIERELP